MAHPRTPARLRVGGLSMAADLRKQAAGGPGAQQRGSGTGSDPAACERKRIELWPTQGPPPWQQSRLQASRGSCGQWNDIGPGGPQSARGVHRQWRIRERLGRVGRKSHAKRRERDALPQNRLGGACASQGLSGHRAMRQRQPTLDWIFQRLPRKTKKQKRTWGTHRQLREMITKQTKEGNVFGMTIHTTLTFSVNTIGFNFRRKTQRRS